MLFESKNGSVYFFKERNGNEKEKQGKLCFGEGLYINSHIIIEKMEKFLCK